VYQFDLFHPPFGAEFDAVCLFDVLEHIRDDAGALKRLKGLLKPGGLLLFTVPAHPWLWCQEDLRAGHERRYSRGALKRLLRTCGFHPLCLRYLFVALLPFLTLRKWVKSDTLVPLHPLVNGVLSALTLLDCCLPNWAGGSLLGVCNADGVDG
jgi:SAM-dependent methyltransferase